MAVFGRIGSRLARRTRFFAQRLWLVAAVEVAWIARRHWRRLDRGERRRLRELVWKSKGRSSRLSPAERREAGELLEKVDYAELGGNVAGTLLPFRPFARLVEYALGRPTRSRRRDAAEA